MRLGLLGYPLGHSFSKQYFEKKFADLGLQNHFYDFFAYANIADFIAVIHEKSDLRGFNVTIPHKTAIIPFLDRLDATATAVGAVNTVCRIGKEWVGYNTDVIGFEKMLFNIFENKKIAANHFFILGNGGASKAVQYVLQAQKIPYTVVSRGGQNNADFLHINNRVISYDLFDFYIKNRRLQPETKRLLTIINTTPLGMAPNINEKPNIAYDYLETEDTLLDLVYNPAKTAFLEAAAAKGCTTQNGEMMLYEQAEAAWNIWLMR